MLAKVIDIAALAHQNRIDKSGHPEILHPLRVGMKLYEMGYAPEIVYAGFLHDVLEDTGMIVANLDWHLKNTKMDDHIRFKTVFYTMMITHAEDETYDEYIERVAEFAALRAIKRVDIEDNKTRDHSGISEEDLARMMTKYEKALKRMEGLP